MTCLFARWRHGKGKKRVHIWLITPCLLQDVAFNCSNSNSLSKSHLSFVGTLTDFVESFVGGGLIPNFGLGEK